MALDLKVGVGLGEQESAVDLGGVGQISGAVEQVFHQSRPLVRTGIIEEVARLGGRRDLADQIEINAAQVFGVIRGRGTVGPWPRPIGSPAGGRSMRRATSASLTAARAPRLRLPGR